MPGTWEKHNIKLRYRCSGHSENTVYLEWSDSCVNIHMLGQVALLGESFPADLTWELFVRVVDLSVSTAQAWALESLEANVALERVITRMSSHVVVQAILGVQLFSTIKTPELLRGRAPFVLFFVEQVSCWQGSKFRSFRDFLIFNYCKICSLVSFWP